MTQPRDPIEDWLGEDVELMPPRPGGFERVHRAARGRKAMRAAGTIGGAAVVVVAAVITPQLAGRLLQHGPGPSRVANGSSHPTPGRTSPQQFQTPRAAGFRPTSVTFVGQYNGFALGRGGTVETTSDYGAHWHPLGSIGAPARVSQIRFLEGINGWAFGPDLYATHNGGSRWHAVQIPGNVEDLATVGNRAFAVVKGAAGGFTLYSALKTSDTWRKVPGATSNTPEQPGGLQLTTTTGYLLASGGLLAGPVTGRAWHRVPLPASILPCLRAQGPALLAPVPNGPEFLACGTPSTTYKSTDGGISWQRLSAITAPGPATSLAAAPTSAALVLATSQGLFYSAHGQSWRAVQRLTGGFAFVGMTTQFLGVAVPADSDLHEIFTTVNGGLTWTRRLIQP